VKLKLYSPYIFFAVVVVLSILTAFIFFSSDATGASYPKWFVYISPFVPLLLFIGIVLIAFRLVKSIKR
jgi:ABC-type multidrug transport system permease subunit